MHVGSSNSLVSLQLENSRTAQDRIQDPLAIPKSTTPRPVKNGHIELVATDDDMAGQRQATKPRVTVRSYDYPGQLSNPDDPRVRSLLSLEPQNSLNFPTSCASLGEEEATFNFIKRNLDYRVHRPYQLK